MEVFKALCLLHKIKIHLDKVLNRKVQRMVEVLEIANSKTKQTKTNGEIIMKMELKTIKIEDSNRVPKEEGEEEESVKNLDTDKTKVTIVQEDLNRILQVIQVQFRLKQQEYLVVSKIPLLRLNKLTQSLLLLNLQQTIYLE